MGASIRGQRLLPSTLDYLSETEPDRVYAAVPRSNDLKDGFRDVSVLEVSRAVDSLAAWIQHSFGISKTFETLAYIGLNDLRYPVAWLAAVKCGYKLLIFSARNTTEQNVHLLEESECRILLYNPALMTLVKTLEQSLEYKIAAEELAPFDMWVASFRTRYPYRTSFQEGAYHPILVLHSSGSTGKPKLAIKTHAAFAAADNPPPEVPGRQMGGIDVLNYDGGGFYYSPFPGSHLAGITALGFFPIFMQSASVILGLPDRPPSLDMITEILKARRMRALYLPPSIIEGLARVPETLEIMKSLDAVVFAGGPLAPPVGDMLSAHVKLSSSYGSTEIGNMPCLLPADPKDWSWMTFHPATKPLMRPSIDGKFELSFTRDSAADVYRGVFHTISEKIPVGSEPFNSNDLFTRHPTKPDLWQFYGRNDDIIVFSNGEKWNPVPSEGTILQHPSVTGVLIIGDGRLEPAALIESSSSLDELWDTIQVANRDSQRFGQINRTKVAILPDGSLVRAPKGTIVRTLNIAKHSHVVEALYNDQQPFSRDIQQDAEAEFIFSTVRRCVRDIFPVSNTFADLFSLGLDSLQVRQIVQAINAALNKASVTTEMIYRNPTIDKLSEALRDSSKRSAKETIQAMYQRLKDPLKQGDYERITTGKLKIALIGSTGSLGTALFAKFVHDKAVGSVICLDRDAVRSEDGARKLELVKDSGVHVRFYSVRLHEPFFGLGDRALAELADTDVIVNSAWKVDFNLHLTSFESLVIGSTNLARWTASLPSPPKVLFISTVAAAETSNESSEVEEKVGPLCCK